MARIVEIKKLSSEDRLAVIEAEDIARKWQPGQFIIVRLHEKGERVPFTIAEVERERGLIKVVFKIVGKTTAYFASMRAGDEILDISGPLGKPTEIKNYGTALCVGGGVGISPIVAVARALREAGNKIYIVLGARTKELIIFDEELREIAEELIITTDDGSYGMKGLVTDGMRMLLEREKIDFVFAAGPVGMMEAVCALTRPYGIRTIVSLNPIMVDGTGMCGACRVWVGGQMRFACVDGPDFDGHQVDFQRLKRRLLMYRAEEQTAYEKFLKERQDGCCRKGQDA